MYAIRSYYEKAFKDACIWGIGGAVSGSVGGPIGIIVGGYAGYFTSTASSINNGNATIDYGWQF